MRRERWLSMTHVKALSLMVAGVAALAMGCSDGMDGSDMGAPDMDDPFYSSMAGGSDGTNGQNHLNSEDAFELRGTLYSATTSDLADYNLLSGKWDLDSNTHLNALKSTPEGRQVLKYAIQCALPTTTTVRYTALAGGLYIPFEVTGQGFLETTGGWLNGGLSTSAAEDLFACMLAHMNPTTVVDINLSGQNVNNDPNADVSDFTWEETLWQANITEGLSVAFHMRAWPLGGFEDCEVDVQELETRVCGSYAGTSCHLDIETTLTTECTEGADGWQCYDDNGVLVPVIKTRLKTSQVTNLYSKGCY